MVAFFLFLIEEINAYYLSAIFTTRSRVNMRADVRRLIWIRIAGDGLQFVNVN